MTQPAQRTKKNPNIASSITLFIVITAILFGFMGHPLTSGRNFFWVLAGVLLVSTVFTSTIKVKIIQKKLGYWSPLTLFTSKLWASTPLTAIQVIKLALKSRGKHQALALVFETNDTEYVHYLGNKTYALELVRSVQSRNSNVLVDPLIPAYLVDKQLAHKELISHLRKDSIMHKSWSELSSQQKLTLAAVLLVVLFVLVLGGIN